MHDLIVDRLDTALAPELRVLRAVGEGAMSHVFLAGETALERLVAVKVLRPELAEDPEAMHRFAREARLAARVVHPNVVSIHRVGTLPEDGLPFLVMEYVEGRTLADLLAAEGTLEPARARGVLAQLAAALAAAHAKRVIHRDVRPANILVERGSERVVLTDFGIAGVLESGGELVTRLTRAGQVLGDPRYLSPERLLGEAATEEADVYSLGVVGFELLTREGPFPGASAAERLREQLNGVPRDLRELRPDVGEELVSLLERCLARHAPHRPRAEQVLRALSEPAPSPAAAAGGSPREIAPPPLFPALSHLLSELQRRRVYRLAAGYAAGVFVVLQVAQLVLPTLGAPEWVYHALVLLALGGMPVTLVLGWMFDLSAEGIRRTGPAPPAAVTGWRRSLIPLAVSLALAGAVGWWALRSG